MVSYRQQFTVCAAVCVLVAHVLPASAVAGQALRPLTVEASVEARRVMPITGGGPISLSPDRSTYAIRLVRDDLSENGSWVEIMTGRTDALASADARVVARLFTSSKRNNDTGQYSTVHPGLGRFAWLDDGEHVAFLWNDGSEPTQIVTANVRTGQLERFTQHPSSVFDFSIDRDRAIFIANPHVSATYHERMRSMTENGFSVSGSNALVLLAGRLDGYLPFRDFELYVVRKGAPSRRVRCEMVRCDWLRSTDSVFSPNGRYAVLSASPQGWPDAWNGYHDVQLRDALKLARSNPDDFDSGHRILQLSLLDFDAAKLAPLWEVPFHPGSPPAVVWSHDNRRLLIGPTLLPEKYLDVSRKGDFVVELDLASGRIWAVPVPDGVKGQLRPKTWTSEDLIVLTDGEVDQGFRKIRGVWKPVANDALSALRKDEAPVRIEVRQGLNEPPTLHAVDVATGAERLILDVEPALRTHAFGRVENIDWIDRGGRTWAGRLHYPVGYVPGQRYPMVIQLVGDDATTDFSLVGSEDFLGTAFAAQILANRGMAVLSIYNQEDVQAALETPAEAAIMTTGIVSAIDHFDRSGLAAADRIGLVGYSRTGWYVEYALTHSDFRFGAAIAADNVNYGYLQALLTLGLGGSVAKTNGAEPFGSGFEAWLRNAPGFNTEKIRTPLRLEASTGGLPSLLASWETYARLRHLQRPVDLVLVPQAEHAGHPLMIPAQKRYSREGTVDWMDFWLNGHEDPDPRKVEQYKRWRELRQRSELQSGPSARSD